MQIIKKKYSDIVFILPLVLNLSACDFTPDSNILDKLLTAGEPYCSILYTKLFAQRFSLDTKSASNLSNNLQAIAVEINKVNNQFNKGYSK